TGNLVAALFSFNVGVELGQLVAVALILAAAALMARLLSTEQRNLGQSVLSAALVMIGLYWLGSRAIGL
ncbi:MAG: HupE/UreJ family protein, partial [Alphaproteobacteria bacterium]